MMPAASAPTPRAGAQFGYTLLWSLIPMTIALYVSEEMCARMGVVTGKGLSDLIREEFGFRSTFFVMIAALFSRSVQHRGRIFRRRGSLDADLCALANTFQCRWRE